MKILNKIEAVRTGVAVGTKMSIGQFFWHKDGVVFACCANDLGAWWD